MATHASALPGIGPGQLVRIAIPGQERASASVTHATSSWLSLRLVGVGAPRPRDLHGVRATVEYFLDDGVHRLRGDLEQADGGSTCAVRFVFSSGDQFVGRRQHLRAAFAAPAVLTNPRTGEKFRGRSVNVSEGGMLVDGLGAGLPGPGTRLKFALAPRNARDPIFGTAIVSRANNVAGELAVEFEPMPRGAADELARIVYENMQGGRASRR
jgi:hypothetical protein